MGFGRGMTDWSRLREREPLGRADRDPAIAAH